ncbi:MAG: MFS transporter [Oscillospiraceae bacterium]|nr:MFS transporter [Oscillospiraceae bacterium]
MKLNYKRTILVGFAFFLISAFWQAYDATIPVILTNKFGMSQTWSGVIMALDNVLAVFMLPLFGALSDKCRGNKYGKRTPFITIGTIIAALALVGLTFVDNAQLKNISEVATIDDPAALTVIYDSQSKSELQTPEGETFVLEDQFSKEEFIKIRSTIWEECNDKEWTNPIYTNYVAPARQAYVAQKTAENSTELIAFVILLLVVLVAMSTFRSPAVALMPDVTIKPLRSKANAVINLMGTAGGILVLVLGIVFATSAVKNAMMSYTVYYAVIAGIMLTALIVFLLTVREKKWAQEMYDDSIRLGIEEETADTTEKRGLSAGEKKSLIFILLSIALWYFGYNAVTSKYSVYATNILAKDYNTTMLLAQAAAIVAYLPAGMVASKIGRKKTIMGGVVMLSGAFAVAAFMRASSPTWLMNAMFILAGIGWATINVNSFPMVVEMCSGSDIGKYTGYYYTASMTAQIATPVLSGFLMDNVAETVLFPYAAIFAALAFLTMAFVKHGDAKPEAKKGLEALDIDD